MIFKKKVYLVQYKLKYNLAPLESLPTYQPRDRHLIIVWLSKDYTFQIMIDFDIAVMFQKW